MLRMAKLHVGQETSRTIGWFENLACSDDSGTWENPNCSSVEVQCISEERLGPLFQGEHHLPLHEKCNSLPSISTVLFKNAICDLFNHRLY